MVPPGATVGKERNREQQLRIIQVHTVTQGIQTVIYRNKKYMSILLFNLSLIPKQEV